MNRHERRARRARTEGGALEVRMVGGALKEIAAGILESALQAEAGAWAEGIVPTIPPLSFELDFDGAGGILFNPTTCRHATGRALLAELKKQAPERVRVGIWPSPRKPGR